jgi:MFS superfamily sulfate permease-like transporter
MKPSNNTHTISGAFSEFKTHFRSDAISGFLVFLIALPLCLGISKASGFPPISGVFTAIIGGLVVSFFSGSALTIKGPAAGLIVIALGAIDELGKGDNFLGYRLALGIIVVAGLIQVAFGLLKMGRLADFFPVTVIHGMLAAIGIIIASKQIHVALGVKPSGAEPLELLAEVPDSILKMNPEIAVIGALSLLILFVLPVFKNKTIKAIPGALVVLLVAIPLGFVFDLDHAHDYVFNRQLFHINPNDFLVVLPANLLDGVTFPDFSAVLSLTGLKYLVMFSLVGSLESLLSTQAIDTLDPYKRKSNLNKDLVAVGIGNSLSGMVGGLPMISEIVRSSANINNGAHTRWSNFFHGFFLLAFVALAAPLIHHIPNAALAAMLLYTGYRLASPKEFYKTYSIGMDQLSIFLTTIFVTLATDLLLGIAAGIVMKLFIQVLLGGPLSNLFKSEVEVIDSKDTYQLNIKHSATFSNFLGFKKYLNAAPKDKKLIIDFSGTRLVDHSFMEHLHHFEEDQNEAGRHIILTGLDEHKPVSEHPMAARKRSEREKRKPEEALLNNRQKSLLKMANEEGLAFIYLKIKSMPHLKYFELAQRQRLLFRENTLTAYEEFGEIHVFDLHLTTGARQQSEEQSISAGWIELPGHINMDFKLVKEDLLEKAKAFSGMQDIDFPEYPLFSRKYSLTSNSPKEVKQIFGEGLVKLLEREDQYQVEAKGKELFILPLNGELLDVNQIKKLLAFCRELALVLPQEEEALS